MRINIHLRQKLRPGDGIKLNPGDGATLVTADNADILSRLSAVETAAANAQTAANTANAWISGCSTASVATCGGGTITVVTR